MIPVDILLDEDGDLLIENGDLVLGDATSQNQKLLLTAQKGSFRHSPLVGVGLINYLKDDNTNEMLREIRLQFSKDGMEIKKLAFENGKLIVVAPYK